MTRGGIVLVGGALVDVRATTSGSLVPGRSVPGKARLLPGGAARNVAVNLVRLGHRVTLLTAVGDDPMGRWLVDVTVSQGVDTNGLLLRPQPTGLFVTVGAGIDAAWCVADAGPVESLRPADLEPWRQAIATAGVLVNDANLSEDAQAALMAMAGDAPRILLATSPDKAVRLRPSLNGAAVVVCNRQEACILVGVVGAPDWQVLGAALVAGGVGRAVITQGEGGVGVATRDETAFEPAVRVPVVDPTGAGDAVAAAAVHGYLAGMSPAQTAVLAASAASCVVQSPENTPAALCAILRT
ncbi:MAG: PfkB family carbohydrate kinase [bacterium]|nr:PfkB family carbohydrate kinase [bacterium]